MPIARYIDISAFREATLVIRIHLKTFSATGSPTFQIVVYADAPSSEDPAQDFTSSALGTNTTITAAMTTPSSQLQAIPANAGSMISIHLIATQGTSAATFNATISIEISEKS